MRDAEPTADTLFPDMLWPDRGVPARSVASETGLKADLPRRAELANRAAPL